MKYGVIDIGSNSVRLLIADETLRGKKVEINAQLAEGLATKGVLSPKPMSRAVDAVKKLYNVCKENAVTEVYCFATESVRSAANGGDFCKAVSDKCGLKVRVLTGEEEALIGFLGAYTSKRCCIVDIGGASTEIIVGDEHGVIYSKSLPIGVVRLKDICGTNTDNMKAYIHAFLSAFGKIADFDEVVFIGGTATTLVSILRRMEVFDADAVHGAVVSQKEVHDTFEYVTSIPLEYRNKIVGLPQTKINIICGGILLIESIMELLKTDNITVSCHDNLEGYLLKNVPALYKK